MGRARRNSRSKRARSLRVYFANKKAIENLNDDCMNRILEESRRELDILKETEQSPPQDRPNYREEESRSDEESDSETFFTNILKKIMKLKYKEHKMSDNQESNVSNEMESDNDDDNDDSAKPLKAIPPIEDPLYPHLVLPPTFPIPPSVLKAAKSKKNPKSTSSKTKKQPSKSLTSKTQNSLSSKSSKPQRKSSNSLPSTSSKNDTSNGQNWLDNQEIKVIEKALKLLKSSNEMSKDPHYTYGLHIANELKKYDTNTLIHVKKAFADILYRADMEQSAKNKESKSNNHDATSSHVGEGCDNKTSPITPVFLPTSP